MNSKWVLTTDAENKAPEGVPVRVIAPSGDETTLKRQGNLWFLPDGSMYVYYQPTHWRPLK